MNITKEGDESLLIDCNGEKFGINYTEWLIQEAFLRGLNNLNIDQQEHIKNKNPRSYAWLKHRSEYK